MIETAIRVGPMQPEHIADCAAIVSEYPLFERYGVTEKSMLRLLSEIYGHDDTYLLEAQLSGKLVGFAWLIPRGAFARCAYIRLITVAPSFKRKGVGRALMRAIEAEFLLPRGIMLLVEASNREARSFYEAVGYRQVGLIPGFVRPGLDECVYFKRSRDR